MLKRRYGIGVVLLITAAVVMGCKDVANDSGQVSAKVPPQPRVETMTIQAGTAIVASLETHLNSDTNHAGDPFVATTTEAIVSDGRTIAPAGTKVRGSLSDVQASGRVKGRARMTLVYHEIVDSAGRSHSISARPLTLQAASKTEGDVEKIAAGGVLGAVIGGIAGGGKGAAIGAGAGAGAGTVLMLATKGDDVELNAGQRLLIHMTAPTSMQVVAQK
jgi:hypothetical protein